MTRQSLEPLYLQYAACGRPSPRTVAAMTAHLEAESGEGGYAAEDDAAPTVQALRTAIGALVGLPETGVALTGGATASLTVLLHAWPLPPSATIAVAPGEWGPNLELFDHHGLRTSLLDVDAHGVVDLDALDRRLRSEPPAVVHLVHLASHRGLVQPIAEVAALCSATKVPLWVDAAQSFAHLDLAAGPDAVYAPARKWLNGPRGVGFLAVREPDRLRVFTPTSRDEPTPVRYLEPEEQPVAALVGMAAAIDEVGPDRLARLAEVGAQVRAACREVAGWQVADPPDAVGALVGLRPSGGQDVADVQRRLAEQHAILTTACRTWRAPADMTEPLLRLALPADLGGDRLDRLVQGLEQTANPG